MLGQDLIGVYRCVVCVMGGQVTFFSFFLSSAAAHFGRLSPMRIGEAVEVWGSELLARSPVVKIARFAPRCLSVWGILVLYLHLHLSNLPGISDGLFYL